MSEYIFVQTYQEAIRFLEPEDRLPDGIVPTEFIIPSGGYIITNMRPSQHAPVLGSDGKLLYFDRRIGDDEIKRVRQALSKKPSSAHSNKQLGGYDGRPKGN